MQESPRRALLVSKGWVQAVGLVMLIGFFIMGLLAYRTYTQNHRFRVHDDEWGGQLLYTGRDVSEGQQVFLHNGLMEYGSAFGHGAYLGPDFTADYLRRSVELRRRALSAAGLRRGREQDDRAFRTNRYDNAAGGLC